MALPAEHVAALRASAEAHERELARLRDAIRIAEEEVGLHEALLELARSDQVLAALEKLHDDPQSVANLAADPISHCKEEGVTLPEGLTINAVEADEAAGRVTIYLGYGGWNAEVIWDREGGAGGEPGFFVRARRPGFAPAALTDPLAVA